ncbi:hypothetical protein SAMN05660690_1750 [Geodermatophilus telluris]|uniref:DUF6542 domain-containing protein n=1 Tax=Geodermatophilus telluris TaxID=1190417 RepID=A0A1G6MBA4_9ACTN|nr:DUF6542 domain-containing protein [Geodermatophilus telluris]SDC52266.1 hypothetical protein SAMN05660690_1750 [Geodermatophilus telluris]
MASVRAADTWRDSGVRPERHHGSLRPDLTGPDRPVRMARPPVPPPPPRGRPAVPAPSRAGGTGRPAAGGARPSQRTPSAAVPPLPDRDDAGARRGGRAPGRPAARRGPSEAGSGSRLRGAVAVLGVFVLTLAGGAVDSFFGVGLGTLTLVTLVAGSAVATLLVRRRDLLTPAVAPPLVFVAVAAVNVGLAPSASLNLPTIATVLVRGFPTMAVATVAALVVAIVRWAARR